MKLWMVTSSTGPSIRMRMGAALRNSTLGGCDQRYFGCARRIHGRIL